MIDNVSVLNRATYEDAKRLIACASLRSIRFVKFALAVELQHGDSAAEVELSTSAKPSGQLSEEGMVLTFDLRVRGKSEDRVLIEVSGRLQALYDIPDEHARPTAAQIKAFAKTNGMLNVWPYWREYVQSATLRAGLPPLTLPLFRVVHEQAGN